MPFSIKNIAAHLAAAAAIVAHDRVSAHSWLEQLNRIAANSTLVGPDGFPPNFPGRDAPGWDDTVSTNMIADGQTTICNKNPLSKEIEGRPFLTAAPGDWVALRYTENGHVTKLEAGRPLNQGTVYVYGTTDPKPEDRLTDVFKMWTADGKGGDGRGRLLATRNYDDGQCYEVNDSPISAERVGQFPKTTDDHFGPNLWCQTDIQLPEDLKGDEYFIYWIWTWPELADNTGSKDGQYGDLNEEQANAIGPAAKHLVDKNVKNGQIYSSCATINIGGEHLPGPDTEVSSDNLGVANSGYNAGPDSAPKHVDYNYAAAAGQLKDTFQVAPHEGEQPAPVPSSAPGNDGGDEAAPAPTSTPPADGIRTVTVTAEPTTVVHTATVTATESTAPTPAPEQPAEGEQAQHGRPEEIAPFMPPAAGGARLRRRNWSFGH